MSVGKVIGNYKISQEIGHGGMGKVYKAIHLSLERIVAIKMIHPKLLSNSDMVARFYSEAKIQAKLNHPNIVTVYDFFEFQDNHYIIMEFVEGESVSKVINHQGPFDIESGTTFFMQILDGINYAHKKNVVHKDIKTSNFILTGTNVKVTDFGIAQIIGDGGHSSESSGVIGTPKYMAPEMILGKKIDHRADIYSLGITYYEFLTGKVPFSTTNRSDFEIRKAQVESLPPPPSEVNPKIPKNIEDIILKSLSKNPDERFESAMDFYNALREINLSSDSNGAHVSDSVPQPIEIKVNNQSQIKTEKINDNYDIYGKLEKTNFAKLLSTFHHEKSNGYLHIGSDFKLIIYFYDGFIQFVECDDPNLRLGKLLVENKTISIKDQESAVEYTLESGLKIGEALIKLGKITPHELSSVLELQLKLKLLNGFRCFEGYYGFKHIDQTEVETIFRIDPIQVIYDAVNQHYIYDDPSANKIDVDGIIKPRDELKNKIYEINLSSIKEIKLANMINKVYDCNISNIVANSPLDEPETFKFLKFLDLSELISIEKSYTQTSNTTQTKKMLIDPLGDKTVLLNESIIAEEMNEGLKKIQ